MSETRPSIAHVLPGMNFGGVEVAIFKSYQSLNQEFDYNVYFVRERGELDVGQCSVVTLLKTIFNYWFNAEFLIFFLTTPIGSWYIIYAIKFILILFPNYLII